MRRAAPGRFAVVAGLAVAAGVGILWPLPAGLLAPVSSTVIVDRNGDRIAERAGSAALPSRATDLAGFGPDLVAATLAAEDHRFRLHPGIDPIGVARAAAANLHAGRIVQGGSTITQQLARTLVARGPGWRGKAAEAWLAVRLDARLSKDEVLREYLSRIFYGNGAVGADAAARLYFARAPAALSLAQAATLAAIPRRPADLDPLRFPLRVRAARDRVLDRVARAGLADPARVAEAKAEPLVLSPDPTEGEAPHFVRRVFRPVPRIDSTLDLGLQREVKALVEAELSELEHRRVRHAAVLVVDNASREVLAYVGSGDWGAADGQVDGARAPRSPGSALKPFLYALAIEKGATLADVVSDTPGTWTTTHGNYHPENYAGSFGGPVTLREALATSLNVPAIRLAEQVGVADFHRRLVDLGLDTLGDRPDHYGLALALGDGEVALDALTAAYAALATGGRWRPLRFTRDAPRPAPRQIIRPTAAFLVADALDDPDARTAAFGHDSVLEPPYPMGAKTGTSTGWRDNWAFGFTPRITVGAWVGNFDGSPMVEVSGITGAGPLMRRVMDAAMEGRPRAAFTAPPGLTRRDVCALSGMTAGDHCAGRRGEWLDGARPRCDWHSGEGTSVPGEYAAWAADRGHAVRPGTAVRVAYPAGGTAFWLDPARSAEDQAIPVRASASGSRATWSVDGVPFTSSGPPFSARWVPVPGDHRLTVNVDGVESPAVRIWVGGGS